MITPKFVSVPIASNWHRLYFTFLWIFVQVEGVREAVWDSGWVGSALPFQRCLVFVITSTNKIFQMTAGKFVPVSNRTMMNVRIFFQISSYVHKGVFKRVCLLFGLILRTGISVHTLLFPERKIKFPKHSLF
jgi:hypothetical protein